MYKPTPVEMTRAVDSEAFLFFLSSAIIRLRMMLNRQPSVPVYSAGITKVRIRGHSTCGKQAKIQGGLLFPTISPRSSLMYKKFPPLVILLYRPNQSEIIGPDLCTAHSPSAASCSECWSASLRGVVAGIGAGRWTLQCEEVL